MSGPIYYSKDECYKNLEKEFRNKGYNWHSELKKFEQNFFSNLQESKKGTSNSKTKKGYYNTDAIIKRICESGKLVKLSEKLQKLTKSERERAIKELENPLLKKLPSDIVGIIDKHKNHAEIQEEKIDFVKECFKEWNVPETFFSLDMPTDRLKKVINNIPIENSNFKVDFLILANIYDIDVYKLSDESYLLKKYNLIKKLINTLIFNSLKLIYNQRGIHTCVETLNTYTEALLKFNDKFKTNSGVTYEFIKEEETKIFRNLRTYIQVLQVSINNLNYFLSISDKLKIYYTNVDQLNKNIDNVVKKISNISEEHIIKIVNNYYKFFVDDANKKSKLEDLDFNQHVALRVNFLKKLKLNSKIISKNYDKQDGSSIKRGMKELLKSKTIDKNQFKELDKTVELFIKKKTQLNKNKSKKNSLPLPSKLKIVPRSTRKTRSI
tara:strand:+ start:347 stop:1660 length:1314 start_codon:yes stop_codon:yes gene_type:complete